MTGDRGTARHSTGPFRLTLQEYIGSAGVANHSRLTRVYGCIASALVTASIQIAIWGISCLALRVMLGPVSEQAAISAVVVAGVLAIFLMLRVINPAILRRQFQGLTASRREFTVNLHDDGVRYSCGTIESSIPWDSIDRVIEKRGCIFLFLDDLMAVIVPRRAFASARDADSFLSFAQTQWNSARAKMDQVRSK